MKEKMSETQKVWKKSRIEFVDLKIGGSVEGTYIEIKKVGERTNEKSGEVTDRHCLILQKKTGEKFQINFTAGLANALANSEVKTGDYVKIDRLEKTTMKDGVTQVNQYDIWN